MDHIHNEVIKVIKRTFSVDAEVNEALTSKDISGWDSFGHLNLILELEKEFKIKFSDEEILRLDSVKNIIQAVSGCCK